jgi:hypothetical protein
VSEASKEARERAIDAFTNAAMRAGVPSDGTTAGAYAKRQAVLKLIEEGVDELLVAAKEADR